MVKKNYRTFNCRDVFAPNKCDKRTGKKTHAFKYASQPCTILSLCVIVTLARDAPKQYFYTKYCLFALHMNSPLYFWKYTNHFWSIKF